MASAVASRSDDRRGKRIGEDQQTRPVVLRVGGEAVVVIVEHEVEVGVVVWE